MKASGYTLQTYEPSKKNSCPFHLNLSTANQSCVMIFHYSNYFRIVKGKLLHSLTWFRLIV